MRWWRSNWILLSILFLGFLVRLYRIDNPIADWHSWRQADTSAVSRNFVKNGYTVLHPRYDDVSNIQSGKDNPEGYRFVEFPIFNVLQASTYQTIDVLSLEEWGRLVTIISSLFSLLFIYLLVKKYLSKTEALFASFFFAFLPFSIYYSRTILPDEMMVTTILGGIYFLDRSIEKKFKTVKDYGFLLVATVLTASSFLLKPYALFFVLPMVYVCYKQFGWKMFIKWQLWVFAVISVFPLIFWRYWMLSYPEGIPVNTWLFNGGDVRFKPYWIKWIIFERLTKLILGFSGIVLLLLGLIKKSKEKHYLFSWSFLVSSILYVVIIARGNLQHDYYQILIIPSLCIMLARGVTFLLNNKKIHTYVSYGLVFIIIAVMGYVSWNGVKTPYKDLNFGGIKDNFNVNNWAMVKAGKKADQILPKNAKVITPYDGDTSFLYQTNRKGWPAFEKGPDELKQMGATHMILLHPTKSDFEGFGKKYKIVAEDKEYLILSLQ